MYKKMTKIIATIGPASESYEKIENLISAGVNVFRFNLKHATVDWHNQRIKRVQKVSDKLKKSVGILVDLQGQEIRVKTREQEDIKIRKGENLVISDSFKNKEASIAISNRGVFKAIKKGDTLLIDNGFIEFEVVKKKRKTIEVKAVHGGTIKHRKNLNLPGKKLKLASLIKEDLERLDMIAMNKIDFVALSFVKTKKDIQVLRKEMKKRNIVAQVVSKIENCEAISNIDEIIEESDSIMIARGDLGIEMPIEELAFWQKEIIRKCRIARKPVVVATQMLHSMIENPRPTRAEATDVANAVFDRTDAVMLSEETATGNYPERAVSTMTRILKFNEEKTRLEKSPLNPENIIHLVSNAVISLTKKILRINAIVAFTESGYTAQCIASLRPKMPVIAITNNKKTLEILTLSYGVHPFYFSKITSLKKVISNLKQRKVVQSKQTLVVLSGKQKDRPELINSFSLIDVV